MHAIAALLATSHLNDLMREADNERRAALVRSANAPSSNRPGGGLGGRIAAAFRRSRGQTTQSTQAGPACA